MSSARARTAGTPIISQLPAKISPNEIPDHRLDAPLAQALRSVLAARPAAEVLVHEEKLRVAALLAVERVVARGSARIEALVLEGVLPEFREGDRLEVAGGDDAVGVDVVPVDGDGRPGDGLDAEVGHGGWLPSRSRWGPRSRSRSCLGSGRFGWPSGFALHTRADSGELADVGDPPFDGGRGGHRG